MPSDVRYVRGSDEAQVARAWEEVRMVRDARWRKNAWCVMGIVMVVWAAFSGEPLALLRLLAKIFPS